MIRVKLDTIAHAGFSRNAVVESVLSLCRHAGGEWYEFDIAKAVTLPAHDAAVAGSLSEYSDIIARAAESMPRNVGASRPGLGDRIASALDSVGITKGRVQALASTAGIADCGCAHRQRLANEIGKKYLGIGKQAPP